MRHLSRFFGRSMGPARELSGRLSGEGFLLRGICQLTGVIDSPGLAMSIDMAMPTNRPHFHVWLQAKTGRMFYKCRPFHTRQTAREWAMRRQAETEKAACAKVRT